MPDCGKQSVQTGVCNDVESLALFPLPLQLNKRIKQARVRVNAFPLARLEGRPGNKAKVLAIGHMMCNLYTLRAMHVSLVSGPRG